MSLWWMEQCPVRSIGLPHAHRKDCKPEQHDAEREGVGHMPFQCCECGQFDPRARATRLDTGTEPPLDVAARLDALGLMPPTSPADIVEDIMSDSPPYRPRDWDEHIDTELVEPKAITGEGPTGNPYGLGRGELTPRFEARLLSYDRYVRRRGEVPEK